MRTNVLGLASAFAVISFVGVLPARGDILDDILSIVTAARDRATEARNNAASARDRATEARNNAATARDTAIEIRDTMQDGILTLSAEVRNAIDEAVDELQQGLAEEFEGRDAFEAGGQAESFRQNLLGLIQDVQTLMNRLFDINGLPTTRVDFSLQLSLIQALPAKALYPMYRTCAVETNLFAPSGIRDALQRAIADIEIIAVALDEPETPEEGALLDKELAVCAPVLDNLSEIRQACADLSKCGSAVKSLGGLFSALGTTEIHKTGAVWGWAGVSLKNNRLKKIGGLLEGIGGAIGDASTKVNVRVRHCVLVGISAETRAREDEILANQRFIMKRLKIAEVHLP